MKAGFTRHKLTPKTAWGQENVAQSCGMTHPPVLWLMEGG